MEGERERGSESGGGKVRFAVQPHREVGPGSWLVKACRITTPFWAESGKEGEEGTWRVSIVSEGGGGCFCYPAAP